MQQNKISLIYKVLLLAATISGITLSCAQPIEGGMHPLNYFTMQSNILVVLALLILAFKSHPERTVAVIRGVVLLSITITSLVFHILLVPYYPDLFAAGIPLRSHLTHTVAPAGFIIDWILFDRKGNFCFADLKYWVIFPLIYWFSALIIGAFTNEYPYFFMDIRLIGFKNVFIWLLLLAIVFTSIGLLFILIDRKLGRTNTGR